MSMSCLDCHDYMNGYNQGKKEGLIEELEKIRQESVRLTESKIMATGTRADGRMDIIDIIDKRISELKGK